MQPASTAGIVAAARRTSFDQLGRTYSCCCPHDHRRWCLCVCGWYTEVAGELFAIGGSSSSFVASCCARLSVVAARRYACTSKTKLDCQPISTLRLSPLERQLLLIVALTPPSPPSLGPTTVDIVGMLDQNDCHCVRYREEHP